MIYNEIDAFCSQWLRNLIEAGHLPFGKVLEVSIADLEHVSGDADAHFFAGIGGWPLALKIAGWPKEIPVWTGSCPCQPFSVAGKGKGEKDERHLWPEFRRLIEQSRPPVIFGEQVASPAGRQWLAAVSTDLEELGYSTASADLCAAGVGAPHIRQRLFWVAVAGSERREGLGVHLCRGEQGEGVLEAFGGCSSAVWVGHANSDNARGNGGESCSEEAKSALWKLSDVLESSGWSDEECEWLEYGDGKTRPSQPGSLPLAHGVPGRVGRLRAYGNAVVPQVAAAFVRAVMELL